MSDARGAASWDARAQSPDFRVAAKAALDGVKVTRRTTASDDVEVTFTDSGWEACKRVLELALAARYSAALDERLMEAEAEVARLREQLDALREAFRTYVDATTFKSSLPDDVGSPNAPTRNAWAVARAALGVEGEPAEDLVSGVPPRVDRTPVDCLLSELRDEFESGGLTRERFEERVAQFNDEVAS